MKVKGFSIASINQKLSAVRQFCTMASKAGVIPADELLMIQTVGTIRQGEGLEIDRQREQSRIDRPNTKKAKSVELTPEQAKLLKTQPDRPQGRRDALLMCLLLDQDMRAGEVAVLMLNNFDLKVGLLPSGMTKLRKNKLINSQQILLLPCTTTLIAVIFSLWNCCYGPVSRAVNLAKVV